MIQSHTTKSELSENDDQSSKESVKKKQDFEKAIHHVYEIIINVCLTTKEANTIWINFDENYNYEIEYPIRFDHIFSYLTKIFKCEPDRKYDGLSFRNATIEKVIVLYSKQYITPTLDIYNEIKKSAREVLQEYTELENIVKNYDSDDMTFLRNAIKLNSITE